LTPPTSPQQVRYIYETLGAPVTYQIPDDDNRDGPRNVGSYRYLTRLVAREDFMELVTDIKIEQYDVAVTK